MRESVLKPLTLELYTTSTGETSDNTTAIIGGTVAGIVLIVAIAVVSIALRSRRGNVTIKSADK